MWWGACEHWRCGNAVLPTLHVLPVLPLPVRPALHVRARCLQNYQLEADHDEGGQWYVGTVAADRRITRPHVEVAADLYGCGGLWERYKVHWDTDEEEQQQQKQADPAAAAAQGGRLGPAAAASAAGMGLQLAGGLHDADGGASTAAAAAAATTPAPGGGDGSGDEDASWLSPWELYAADVSTEAVLAAEHSTQLAGEQVSACVRHCDTSGPSSFLF